MTHITSLNRRSMVLYGAIALVVCLYFAPILYAAPPIAQPTPSGPMPSATALGGAQEARDLMPERDPFPNDHSVVAQILRKYGVRHSARYSILGPLPVASLEKNVIRFPTFRENKNGGLRVDLNGKRVTVRSGVESGGNRSLADVQPGQRIMVAQRENEVIIILVPKVVKENSNAH